MPVPVEPWHWTSSQPRPCFNHALKNVLAARGHLSPRCPAPVSIAVWTSTRQSHSNHALCLSPTAMAVVWTSTTGDPTDQKKWGFRDIFQPNRTQLVHSRSLFPVSHWADVAWVEATCGVGWQARRFVNCQFWAFNRPVRGLTFNHAVLTGPVRF